eukprot:scaffold22439_cov108-Isochrysis_galbana.AAC.3
MAHCTASSAAIRAKPRLARHPNAPGRQPAPPAATGAASGAPARLVSEAAALVPDTRLESFGGMGRALLSEQSSCSRRAPW